MLIVRALTIIAAFLLDQLFGDPRSWPHPVVLMGKAISLMENKFNKGSSRQQRGWGILLTLFIVGGTYIAVFIIQRIAFSIHPLFKVAIQIYFIWTTIAAKSLLEAGEAVLVPLQNGEIEIARTRLSWFVSRDTANLSESEIVRGTVETIAENFVDGILSPLIFAALGGAPLAMAFKAVSTLDSMVGYRNERFKNFGWFSARTDDWANFIPARVSIPILLLAGFFQGLPVSQALTIWKRDAHKHPSPNGGNPESVVAGLLGIQLGGINIYHGQKHHRAEMGDALRPLLPSDITRTQSLIKLASWLALSPILLLAVSFPL